jgi:hypothetical protein
MRLSTLKNLVFAIPVVVLAQTADLKMGVVYQCPAVQATMQVFSCTGPAATDSCDVQTAPQGRPAMRGKSPRQQVMALLRICHLQTPAEAQGAVRSGPAGAPVQAASQAGLGGFKVGDTVQINTAFGWMNAKVMQVNGANYFVHADSGADVWKPYPTEVRRIGPLNAEDHAHGLYDLHDRVQVLYQGKWVDSEVVTTFALGDRYEVTLPGNQTGYATPQQMRFVSVAPPKPTTKAGVPPKPGFASCGTRFDGRWGSANGGPGPRIAFQAGKANVDDGLTPQTMECWVNGDQMILRLVNDPLNGGSDITFDINKDGTIESTYFGQLKKR